MAWSKNGTNTLTSGSNTLELTGLTKLKFNQIITHIVGASASLTDFKGRVGDGSFDSGSNYASRESQNGGADNTRTSATTFQSGLTAYGNANAPSLHIVYGINIDTEEKLFIEFACLRNTAGAGNAPNRFETVYKWTNTSSQYDQFEYIDNTGDTYDTDSNLSALGTD